MERTFLITGATGFIGSHLVSTLIETYGPGAVTALVPIRRNSREELYWRRFRSLGVRLVECDLLALPEMNLQPPAFDVVYHLAAFAETENPQGRFEVNNLGTAQLLEWLGPHLAGKRFVYTGTLASIDRDPGPEPITEQTPCTPKTLYGKTKWEGEQVICSQQQVWGYEYTILRLCTILGPGFRSKGMFGLLPQLLEKNSLLVRLNWPGKLSLLSVSDLVQLLVALPELPATANQLYLLSNGQDVTFDALIDQIAELLGLNRKRIELSPQLWRWLGQVAWFINSMPWVPYRLHNLCWRMSHIIFDGLSADASKLRSVYPRPFQSLRESLQVAYGKQFKKTPSTTHQRFSNDPSSCAD